MENTNTKTHTHTHSPTHPPTHTHTHSHLTHTWILGQVIDLHIHTIHIHQHIHTHTTTHDGYWNKSYDLHIHAHMHTYTYCTHTHRHQHIHTHNTTHDRYLNKSYDLHMHTHIHTLHAYTQPPKHTHTHTHTLRPTMGMCKRQFVFVHEHAYTYAYIYLLYVMSHINDHSPMFSLTISNNHQQSYNHCREHMADCSFTDQTLHLAQGSATKLQKPAKTTVAHLLFGVSHVVLEFFDDSLHEFSSRRELHDHPMLVILLSVR